MKKNEIKTMRGKTLKELMKLVSEKKSELLKFSSKKVSSGEKNLKKGRILRKEIAQILTLVKEMEIIKKEETK